MSGVLLEIEHDALRKDEMAVCLQEYDEPVPGQGMRRMQYIAVVRGEEIASFRVDLGPAGSFVIHPAPIDIRAGVVGANGRLYGCMNVEAIMEMADQMRSRPMAQLVQEELLAGPEEFAREINEELHEGKMRQRNTSVSGPLYRKERS